MKYISGLMLEGVRVFDLKKIPDERGFFSEVFRSDWKELIGSDTIVQVNFSLIYPDTVKAWHRHANGKIEYFSALRGAIKVCTFDFTSRTMDEIFLSGEKLQIARIPGNFWHGIKAIGNEPAYMLSITTQLYDYDKPDEERRAWNDSEIIPLAINGNTNDRRVRKPWDWFFPPHK